MCQWDAEGPSPPSAGLDQISSFKMPLLPEFDLHYPNTDFSAIQIKLLLRTNIQVRYTPNGRVGTCAWEALQKVSLKSSYSSQLSSGP